MTGTSRWLRRVEIALWVTGVALLGVALGVTYHRWTYQAEQEEAFLRSAAASPLPSASEEGTPSLAIPPELPALDGELGESPENAEPGPPASPPSEAQVSPAPAAVAPPAPARPEPDPALDPSVLGRLEIPRLGLRVIVREGEDEATFARAVGYLPGTARPGEGGNTALAAHRDTFFRPLQKIEVDDRIRLVVPPHTYEYRVASVRVVEPTEVSVLESNGTEELTLITCYPFRYIGPAPDRFVVKATRVP